MKTLLTGFALFFSTLSAALAHGHAQHNMVLFGENEIFASHIVYRQPHNYQVILAIRLDEAARAAYLAVKQDHPAALIRLKLDDMDIATIDKLPSISGPILYEDEAGVERVAVPRVTLARKDFTILYFDELPLSLAGGGHPQEP